MTLFVFFGAKISNWQPLKMGNLLWAENQSRTFPVPAGNPCGMTACRVVLLFSLALALDGTAAPEAPPAGGVSTSSQTLYDEFYGKGMYGDKHWSIGGQASLLHDVLIADAGPHGKLFPVMQPSVPCDPTSQPPHPAGSC